MIVSLLGLDLNNVNIFLFWNGNRFEMAPRRTYRKKRPMMRRRAGYGKRKGGYRRSTRVMISRGISPVAPRFITQLKYADEWIGPSTSGIPQIYTFNLNSLYDPNRTATGHQPFGFDQLAALYDKYRVFAASWRIDVTGNGTGDIPRVVVIPFDGNYNNTSRTLAMEFPRAVTKVGAPGNNKVSIAGRVSLPRLRGQTSVAFKGDDQNTAQTGANPGHEVTLNVITSSVDSATTLNFQGRITMIFHCEFYDPANPGQS